MTKINDPIGLSSLARGLSDGRVAWTPRRPPVRQAAATLTLAMNKTNEPGALGSLVQGLSAVSGRLDPKEAAARRPPPRSRWP